LNILIVTDSYPPEIRSASDLMLELAEELSNRCHKITVITNWPEYNLDHNVILNKITEKKIENNVTVIRIKTLPHHNVNYLLRGIAELFLPIKFLWKIYQYNVHADAIVVYSPPLSLSLVGSWFWNKPTRLLLNVQDLFPQNAIDLKILKNSWQIKFFRALESFAYRTADIVTVHSEGNKQTVLERYPNLVDKIQILHNWVDLKHHENKNINLDFRRKWNIQQKHVAVFAGVIGPSQYFDLILYVAEKMLDQTQLLFLLVGDGKEKKRLQKLSKAKSLENVRFEGFVSRELYPDLLQVCDIGLVCLNPRNKTPVVPGKILGYMAAGLPIAAFLQSSSDGHGIVRTAQCGFSTDSDDKEGCVHAMRNLMSLSNSFSDMGKNGKKYAKNNFSKKSCISRLESILLDVVK